MWCYITPFSLVLIIPVSWVWCWWNIPFGPTICWSEAQYISSNHKALAEVVDLPRKMQKWGSLSVILLVKFLFLCTFLWFWYVITGNWIFYLKNIICCILTPNHQNCGDLNMKNVWKLEAVGLSHFFAAFCEGGVLCVHLQHPYHCWILMNDTCPNREKNVLYLYLWCISLALPIQKIQCPKVRAVL